MRGAAFILLLTLLFQIGVKTGVLIWFKANQTYISETMCINRDKPMLNCDGKCVLAQKIKQAENRRENQPVPLSEIDNEVLPCVLLTDKSQRKVTITSIEYERLKSLYDYHPIHRFFHPPPHLV